MVVEEVAEVVVEEEGVLAVGVGLAVAAVEAFEMKDHQVGTGY